MAKQADFEISTVSADEAQQTLRQLRAGRGGAARRSKYQPIFDALEDAAAGEIVVVKGMPMSGIMSVRAKAKRIYPDGSVSIKSAAEKGGTGADKTFVVMVGRAEAFGEGGAKNKARK